MAKYQKRSDVPDKYKWNLEDYFQNEEEYNKSYSKCLKKIKKLKKYVGLISNGSKLYEFLNLDIETNILLENMYVYAYLKNDEELGIRENKERKTRIEDLYNEYNLSVNFFEPELLKLDKDKYQNLFKEETKLKEYKKALDKIYRSKKHIISEDKESIISDLTNAMDNFDDMSSTMLNSLHDYGKVVIDNEEESITPSNLRHLLKNKNASIRKEVYEKYNKVLGQYGVLSAEFLNSYVKANIVKAKLHHFKNAWEQKLFYLEMPNEAYEALVKTVTNNTGVLQKYFRIFKDTLGLKELHSYDLNLDLAKSEKKYSISEAEELILKAIKPLGEDYTKLFKRIFTNHYIDYCGYKGKCSGAYSFGTMDKDSRILMSFNDDLASVSTIIHEGGHNVHHHLVNKNNSLIYRSVPSLLAEVASLTNECLLSHYVAINGADNNEKKAGISNILDVMISNLFGAVREGKMEQDFYNHVLNGNSITKEYMNSLTHASLKHFYGEEVTLDKYSDYSWMRRSHYYMNYYLYSYAFCISVASYVAKEIISGNKEMLNNYMKYLTIGSDVKPTLAFKVLGIDLTDTTVYEGAINYFDELLEEFKKLQ